MMKHPFSSQDSSVRVAGRWAVIVRALSRGLAACLLAGFVLWGALALWYQAGAVWRWPALVLWLCIGLHAVFRLAAGRKPGQSQAQRRVWRYSMLLAALLLLGWWSRLQPSHDRIWADDVAHLLEAEVSGNHVTLHNVRNFDWRSATDYTPRWETREYDLDQLVSADLLLSYWMGPAIAHTLVSFGFADGQQLVFSLEIRKESHESFSAIAGFFRQYEVVLIAADENDIVRVRTNARDEEVQLYRLALTPDQLKTAFLGYLDEAQSIGQRPRFYNTLTSNCTTIVMDLGRQIADGLPLDYRVLLSGYFAEYAYEQGALTPGQDYAALQAAGDITRRARAFSGAPGDFPLAIRQTIPGIPPADKRAVAP
ncbi:Lnb N-terminal periplasmic domain-containing protein [Kerstersia sp.]|uniref:Lnb N-terminal periplasmic domain-containing protein n=1 Tax=Kerstersia sp. TaxID=1930783 RepID=UPI003F8DC165